MLVLVVVELELHSEAEKIGQRRVDRLRLEFEQLGYFVETRIGNNTGVDMIVVCCDREKATIIQVLEVTNYARRNEYINCKKFNRYVDTLNRWNRGGIKRTLVVSYWENLNGKQISCLQANNIEVMVVGYQD